MRGKKVIAEQDFLDMVAQVAAGLLFKAFQIPDVRLKLAERALRVAGVVQLPDGADVVLIPGRIHCDSRKLRLSRSGSLMGLGMRLQDYIFQGRQAKEHWRYIEQPCDGLPLVDVHRHFIVKLHVEYPSFADGAPIGVYFSAVEHPEGSGAELRPHTFTEVAHDLSEIGPPRPFAIALYVKGAVLPVFSPIVACV